MQFAKRLRDRVALGEITTSVRIWRSARVKVGHRYAMQGGFVVIETVKQIDLSDITPEMARASGFAGIVDLLKTAKHGSGEKVFLVHFRYEDS